MIDPQIIEEAKKLLIGLKKDDVAAITEKVLSEGGSPLELMNKAFIPALNDVGKMFSRGKMFLPELVQAADAMKVVTERVDEELLKTEERKEEIGTVIIATVKGDVHDIGKCIVVSLFKANGFTVHDLGRDVAVDTIIEQAVKVDADVIGTSALLTTTMPQQTALEDKLRSEGLRDRFKTLVGGAPVTPRWATQIGADAYAEDAQDGVNKVKQMLAAR